MTSKLLLNQRQGTVDAPAARDAVRGLHHRLPGYAPTPLIELPELAASLGIGRALVKAEVQRMGLPSFKILGASWATYRVLAHRMGAEPTWSDLPELADAVQRKLGDLTLVTATDGNHGRAVARMAKLLGLSATILVPSGTAAARIDAIASEGADAIVVDGSYDDAVARAAAMASDTHLVVSDTSWPGYTDPPGWVIEGYTTIFAELTDQLPGLGVPSLDAVHMVVIPIGVGALAAAAARNLRAGRAATTPPQLLGVEPRDAACVLEAVAAGEVVEVPGPHRSIMAGLNCGRASMLALPTVAAGFQAIVAVDDDTCSEALRLLAASGLDVGETAAAALAGLMAVSAEHRSELPLPDDATVVMLATEGVTDPESFTEIVGRPPR